LSLYGMNFGEPSTAITSPVGSLTLTRDALPIAMNCFKAGWASDKAMSCATPPGIGAVFSLDVNSAAPLSGVTHSGKLALFRNRPAFQYDAPVVTAVTSVRSNLPTKGGALVTITGSISVLLTRRWPSVWVALRACSPHGFRTRQ